MTSVNYPQVVGFCYRPAMLLQRFKDTCPLCHQEHWSTGVNWWRLVEDPHEPDMHRQVFVSSKVCEPCVNDVLPLVSLSAVPEDQRNG